MQYFHVLDHILVSELLYNEAVCSAEVCHDIDNTSDHELTCELIVMFVGVRPVSIRKGV